MRKNCMSCILTIIVFIASVTMCQAAEAEYYTSKKIQLNGIPINTNLDINKRYLEPSNAAVSQFAVDDNLNLYVLDIYGKKVFRIRPKGDYADEIFLNGAEFPYTSKDIDDGHMDYLIQVSSDGKLIYVTEGTDDFNWSIYNESGISVRKNMPLLTSFERVCSEFKTEDKVLDARLNLLKQVTKHVYAGEIFDSNSNFYTIKSVKKATKQYLTKLSSSRKEIWKIELNHKKVIRLLGADGNDNIYVLVEEPAGITKVNKEGQVVANISFSKDPNLPNVKFNKGVFKILCDGTIYLFPPTKIPSKQMKIKEYSVYKFDKFDR